MRKIGEHQRREGCGDEYTCRQPDALRRTPYRILSPGLSIHCHPRSAMVPRWRNPIWKIPCLPDVVAELSDPWASFRSCPLLEQASAGWTRHPRAGPISSLQLALDTAWTEPGLNKCRHKYGDRMHRHSHPGHSHRMLSVSARHADVQVSTVERMRHVLTQSLAKNKWQPLFLEGEVNYILNNLKPRNPRFMGGKLIHS